MIIKKVSRSYSRSLNTKNYGLPESWIKIEATYDAECESGDDAVQVSTLLSEQAKKDVLTGINQVIEQIQASKVQAATPQVTQQVPAPYPTAQAPQVTQPRSL